MSAVNKFTLGIIATIGGVYLVGEVFPGLQLWICAIGLFGCVVFLLSKI